MIYIEIVRRTPAMVFNPNHCTICGRPLLPGQVQALLLYPRGEMRVAHLTCYAGARKAEKAERQARQRLQLPAGRPS